MLPLSRRRLLAGLPLVGACGRGQPPAVRRAFVGPSPERGHRIRDGVRAARSADERVRTQVAIIGGGVAGVCAAWRLRRAGVHDVQLFELEDELGGTARSGRTERSAYPMGAHYLPAPHPSFRGLLVLLRELGVVLGTDAHGQPELDPRWVCRGPVERHKDGTLWRDGLYPGFGESAAEGEQMARLRDLLRGFDGRIGADGRRLFDLPVQRSSTELRGLDGISATAWLDGHGLVSERLRWLVDYACHDDYGCEAAHTSAFAMLHHFLARGLEDERDRFLLVWPEGNAWLVARTAEAAALDERVHRGAWATAIDPDLGRVTVERSDGAVLEVEADVVLWAAPRFVLRHVLPAGRDPLPAEALGYAPWLVANVGLSQPPRGHGAPLSWDNVARDYDDLGYVVATHNEPLDARAPGTVITYYRPLPAADLEGLRARRSELLAADLDTLCDDVVARLSTLHPDLAQHVTSIDVTRWGHGMIRPVPGLLFGPVLAQARAPIGRVVPCAADVGGLPLFEEAFASGVAGAEAALRRIGRAQASIL